MIIMTPGLACCSLIDIISSLICFMLRIPMARIQEQRLEEIVEEGQQLMEEVETQLEEVLEI